VAEMSRLVIVKGKVCTCTDYDEPLVIGLEVRRSKGGTMRLAVAVPDTCDTPAGGLHIGRYVWLEAVMSTDKRGRHSFKAVTILPATEAAVPTAGKSPRGDERRDLNAARQNLAGKCFSCMTALDAVLAPMGLSVEARMRLKQEMLVDGRLSLQAAVGGIVIDRHPAAAPPRDLATNAQAPQEATRC
jgi:hypothetical protein